MTMPPTLTVTVDATLAGKTLAAILRGHLPDHSWKQIHRLIEKRRLRVAGELWTDPARRMKEGDLIEVLAQSIKAPRQAEQVKIRFLDAHVVVVEKPSGISTVRHPSEVHWPAERKALSPTLQDIVPRLIAARSAAAPSQRHRGPLPRLRIVHRIDKETSGLVVFARTATAEANLGLQFRKHTVIRRYFAIVPGRMKAESITSRLVRDRGDGRRGSTSNPTLGKVATTHVEVAELLPRHTILSCRLETGRTHQIRIHFAERGHPICGEKVYNRTPGQEAVPDKSGAPRLALHAAELGFEHPVTSQDIHWTMPLPEDLTRFIEHLRQRP
jgi:23S rRNA pseudouridine1911/1915/1917 synthase